MSTPGLTNAEFWILLTLDDASSLGELLTPIAIIEERPSRLPWGRWERRQIRPALELRDAAEGLTSLVTRALVEIREVDVRPIRPSEQRRVRVERDVSPEEWVEAILVGAEPHPFDTGRPLTVDEASHAIRDALNWEYPAETDRDVTYWVASTDDGERAYADAQIQLENGNPGRA